MSLLASTPSDLSVLKEIVQMEEKAGDQSALLLATGLAVIALKGVVILLWRKWESARKQVKLAAEKRETLIEKHANQMDSLRAAHALEIKELNRDMNRTSDLLADIQAELRVTRKP